MYINMGSISRRTWNCLPPTTTTIHRMFIMEPPGIAILVVTAAASSGSSKIFILSPLDCCCSWRSRCCRLACYSGLRLWSRFIDPSLLIHGLLARWVFILEVDALTRRLQLLLCLGLRHGLLCHELIMHRFVQSNILHTQLGLLNIRNFADILPNPAILAREIFLALRRLPLMVVVHFGHQ